MFDLKATYKRVSGFFLLIIFCGYFGSITLFPHTHIVDGIQIVHSHPYKSHSDETPVNHDHSTQDYLLIRFISNLCVTIPILFSGITILHKSLNVRPIIARNRVCKNIFLLSRHLPRAPSF